MGREDEEPGPWSGFKGTWELQATRPDPPPAWTLPPTPPPPGYLPASSDHTRPLPCTQVPLLAEGHPSSRRTETL